MSADATRAPGFRRRPAPEGALAPDEYLAVEARTGETRWCATDKTTNAKGHVTGYLVRLATFGRTRPSKFDAHGRGTKEALFWCLVADTLEPADAAKKHACDLQGAYGRPERRRRTRKVDPRQADLFGPPLPPAPPDLDPSLDPFSDPDPEFEWE